MLKFLHLHHKQSTKVLLSTRFKSWRYLHYVIHAHCKRNAQISSLNTVSPESKHCIHTAGLPVHASAVAVERSKYGSNSLPRNARIVICGGGVMGGMVIQKYNCI